jgi:hypothetical protein
LKPQNNIDQANCWLLNFHRPPEISSTTPPPLPFLPQSTEQLQQTDETTSDQSREKGGRTCVPLRSRFANVNAEACKSFKDEECEQHDKQHLSYYLARANSAFETHPATSRVMLTFATLCQQTNEPHQSRRRPSRLAAAACTKTTTDQQQKETADFHLRLAILRFEHVFQQPADGLALVAKHGQTRSTRGQKDADQPCPSRPAVGSPTLSCRCAEKKALAISRQNKQTSRQATHTLCTAALGTAAASCPRSSACIRPDRQEMSTAALQQDRGANLHKPNIVLFLHIAIVDRDAVDVVLDERSGNVLQLLRQILVEAELAGVG